MIHITHTTPGRLLGHLCKLQREGEVLLTRLEFLTPADEIPWDGRVWRCLDKIASRDAFDAAIQRNTEDVGPVDLLDWDRPIRSDAEMNELLRRRIGRRLGTLASVIEKVEAIVELSHKPPRRPS